MTEEKNIMERGVIEFNYDAEVLKTDGLRKLVSEMKTAMLNADTSDMMAVVKNNKSVLVKIRTSIMKQEKIFVEEANLYKKTVFDKRKEYLGITQPLEDELKEIIFKADLKIEMKARKGLLPEKKVLLSVLKIAPVSDKDILEMNAEEWNNFYIEKQGEHKETLAREKKEDQIRKEAEEKGREEEKRRNEREKEEKERIKEVEEKRVKDEEEKKVSDEKYKNWLSENNYNPETDKIINDKIYRLVSKFEK